MSFLLNLRYTLRQIKKSPGFFLIAIVALALGIGANTAIFSAVEAVLLKPLPFAQPGRLMIVWEDASYIGFAFNYPRACELRGLAGAKPGIHGHGGNSIYNR